MQVDSTAQTALAKAQTKAVLNKRVHDWSRALKACLKPCSLQQKTLSMSPRRGLRGCVSIAHPAFTTIVYIIYVHLFPGLEPL